MKDENYRSCCYSLNPFGKVGEDCLKKKYYGRGAIFRGKTRVERIFHGTRCYELPPGKQKKRRGGGGGGGGGGENYKEIRKQLQEK